MRDIRSMDVLETLSVALGLATLAGINLYLTVFVTGMAVQFGWVLLPSHLHDLSVLGNPWVIAISGALYLLEFFADKVPWIDTANDALHTFIRPFGGALLAVLALGEADPAVKVIAALLAGGAALTAHAAKAGTRLMANVSPEPFSNIGLSLGEDAIGLGWLGTFALASGGCVHCCHPCSGRHLDHVSQTFEGNPLHALARMAQVERPIRRAGGGKSARRIAGVLSRGAPAQEGHSEPVAFAARCISDGGPGMPKGHFGWLARFGDGSLFFVGSAQARAAYCRNPLGRSFDRTRVPLS